MKYRKKPVVIEAWQFTGEHRSEWPSWLAEADCVDSVLHLANATTAAINIATLEGTMRANKGDWIIKGTKGELYPCKPDIFAALYEAAE